MRIYAFYESSFNDPSSFSLLIVIAVEGGSVAMTEVSLSGTRRGMREVSLQE